MRLRYKSVKYNKLNPIIFHTPSMAKFSKNKRNDVLLSHMLL